MIEEVTRKQPLHTVTLSQNEVHKALVAYVLAHGKPETVAALQAKMATMNMDQDLDCQALSFDEGNDYGSIIMEFREGDA